MFGWSVAQVRVMIWLPPCPASIRRIVVLIGSDGVPPRRPTQIVDLRLVPAS
jgi:hypothetical protein